MAKSTSTNRSKTADHLSLGRARDGVVILRPAVGPKHFTQSQIEKTVDAVRDATGRFLGRAPVGPSRVTKSR
jgi:hypothetical protein